MNTKEIKVLSFDMFQTLVDVNPRIPFIWKPILGDYYSEEKVKKCLSSFDKVFISLYKEAVLTNNFVTLESLYKKFAKEVIKDEKLDKAPYFPNATVSSISKSFLREHGYAPFYDDTLSVLKELQKNYKIILSSDADFVMINPIIKRLEDEGFYFYKKFISEEIKAYKGNLEKRFFTSVCSSLIEYSPSQILHIGDSTFDVVGANRCKMCTCHINHHSEIWKNDIKPDLSVSSLKELQKLLLK